MLGPLVFWQLYNLYYWVYFATMDLEKKWISNQKNSFQLLATEVNSEISTNKQRLKVAAVKACQSISRRETQHLVIFMCSVWTFFSTFPCFPAQPDYGNLHFPFILKEKYCTPATIQANKWSEWRFFCEWHLYALKHPTRLMRHTIHWPSGCQCQQRSHQNSPFPASWDARTPCPSGAVL